MQFQNLMTAHFSKRETALKWLMFSMGYFFLFVFLENPVNQTISLIGKNHIILFFIFCVVYSLAMVLNLLYMKRNFKIKNRLFYYTALIFSLCFGFVATTLMPNKQIGEISVFATIVHWVFGFGGILVNAVCVHVILLSFMKEKRSKALRWVFSLSTGTCVLDLLVFIAATVICGGDVQKSKNGFLEIVPMTVTFLVLYVINHTDLVVSKKERDERENEFIVKDTGLFSAFSFFFLVCAAVMFNLFAFVRNPIHFTISMTGLDYPIGFAVTSVLLSIAFILNYIKMFRDKNYKNVFVWALAIVGPLSILACVLSPTTAAGNGLDLVHSVAALMFFYFILASFILYYFHFRRDKKRAPFLIITIAITLATTITAVLLFVVFKQRYGRTGLTEVVPLEFSFVCFFLENYSGYFSKEKITDKIPE